MWKWHNNRIFLSLHLSIKFKHIRKYTLDFCCSNPLILYLYFFINIMIAPNIYIYIYGLEMLLSFGVLCCCRIR